MADGWSYADEVYGLIPVQEGAAGARRQPGPTTVPIPGSGQPRQVRPKAQPPLPPNATPLPEPQAAPAEPAKPYSYADEVFASPVQPKPAAPVAADPNAEPDAPTWWGRRVQDVRGKTDKRYQNLPTLADTGAVMMGDDSVAKITMPNDEAYADILTKSLAPGVKMTRRFKDANGYEIVGFSYEDGPEQLAYVNQPGLDTSDVSRGVIGALPFMAGGGLAGRALAKVGAPLLGKVVGQAATGAAVSVGQDAAAYGIGSEQGLDGAKLIGSAAGGALGEVIAPAAGALWRKFVAEPRLFNKATGRLTPQGEAAAKAAGMDPAEMTAEIQKNFAQMLAKSRDAKASSIAAETGDLNIPTTLGQRTKNRAQLSVEQEIRHGIHGQKNAAQMEQLDDMQAQAIYNAVMGEIEPGKPGMSLTLQPQRSPSDYSASQIGAAIGERASMGVNAMKAAAKSKWQEVGELTAPDGALAELPRYISASLGDMKVRPPTLPGTGQPVATEMLTAIDDFMKGQAPKQVVEWINTTPTREVNKFRTTLSEAYRELPKGSADRVAAERIYDGYRSWIREMADRGMLEASNPDQAIAAAAMREASGMTYNIHNLLNAGGNKRAANILKQIVSKEEGADSAGNIIRNLFVGPDSKSVKPGAMAALDSLLTISKQLPGDEGALLRNDLKLAHWLTLVRDPAGEAGRNAYSPQVMLRNLRNSREAHREIWMKLHTPQEIALRNRLIRALENGPTFFDKTIKINSSNSAMSAGRMVMDALSGVFGANYAKVSKELFNKFTGRSRAAFYNATRQDVPAINPMLGPPLSAGGAAGASSQE